MTHDGALQCGTREEDSAGSAGFAAADAEAAADRGISATADRQATGAPAGVGAAGFQGQRAGFKVVKRGASCWSKG